jgi:hypothetical protein
MERETGLEPATSSLGSWHSSGNRNLGRAGVQTVQFQTSKSIEELRKSSYHKQLGRNVCAAFIAQQQGIRLDTAHKKIEEPIGDLWLLMAEIIRQQCFEGPGTGGLSGDAGASSIKTIQ